MKKVIFLIFLLSKVLYGQELSDTTYGRVYYNNFSLGLIFNMPGWGVTGEYVSQITYKYKQSIGLTLTNIHHKNEFKVSGISPIKTYYYKKINSLVAIRPTYGGNLLLFKSKRDEGIEIKFKWKLGPSFGFVKPVYLRISKNSTINPNVDEQYDPEIHNYTIIEGKSSWWKGVGQGKFEIGMYNKTGFNFNFSNDKSSIKGGEIGFMIDYYPLKEIEIMYGIKNYKIFTAFYLQFELGNKF